MQEPYPIKGYGSFSVCETGYFARGWFSAAHILFLRDIEWDKTTQRSRTLMEVDLIFKIAAIGILVAVLNQLLVRSGREEQAMMTTLAGLVDT